MQTDEDLYSNLNLLLQALDELPLNQGDFDDTVAVEPKRLRLNDKTFKLVGANSVCPNCDLYGVKFSVLVIERLS